MQLSGYALIVWRFDSLKVTRKHKFCNRHSLKLGGSVEIKSTFVSVWKSKCFFRECHVKIVHCMWLIASGSMAESGIDLTFDDQTTYDSTGNSLYVSSSSVMAHHLQTLSVNSG